MASASRVRPRSPIAEVNALADTLTGSETADVARVKLTSKSAAG